MNNSHEPHLKFKVLAKMAFANLRFKKFRSVVTLAGVTIGIGSVYLLLSFGLGLQSIVKGEVIGNKLIETVDITSPDPTIIRLSQDNTAKISSINNIKEVSGLYIVAGQVTSDSSTLDVVVYGIDNSYQKLSDLKITKGDMVDTSNDTQVVVSQSLVKALNLDNDKSVIGKTININFSTDDNKLIKKDLKIVGISGTESSGLEIFIPQTIFNQSGSTDYSQLKVVVNSRENISQVRKIIESFGFDTTSPIDTLDQVDQVFKVFNLILAGLGGIGLVIAILGMLNTLTVSLLERTREIALMITIGARPKDMRRLFMTEALMLSIVGGVAGVIIAWSAGEVINFFLNNLSRARGIDYTFNVFYRSPLLMLAMIVLMGLIGLIVSYVPAHRASRINPIDALRHE
jgi:ABC-type antimicrobial peptide transport system permease subunit